MHKRYTIFTSSTLLDLLQERDAVSKAILELGHIPVGMEMFSAGNEEQWQLIKRQIDECDYYVVIIAHRYGSLVGDVSYTEREYDYAVEKGVPALGFIIDDDASWPGDRHEQDGAQRQRLAAFKQKVKGKIVSFWKNADDLNGRVIAALAKQFTISPRPGWVRATEVPGAEVITELSRLSKENAELRQQVAEVPKPVFEILFAQIEIEKEYAHTALPVNMTLLVHYQGSSIYLPRHRCRFRLVTPTGHFDTEALLHDSSSLIEPNGGDFVIEGSGFIELLGTLHVGRKVLTEPVELQLCIRLKSDEETVLKVPLSGPKWQYGEEGVSQLLEDLPAEDYNK